MNTRSTPIFAKRFLPIAALALAATFCFSSPAEAQTTILCQWDFNKIVGPTTPSSGTNPTGVAAGYSSSSAVGILNTQVYTGSMSDPGLTYNGTVWNRGWQFNARRILTASEYRDSEPV